MGLELLVLRPEGMLFMFILKVMKKRLYIKQDMND